MSATTTINLGSCWSCIDDLSMPSRMASGVHGVAEAVARRFGTTAGTLIDDPDYGYNLSDFVGDDLGPRDLALIGFRAAAEAQKDERVKSCSVTITLTVAGVLTAAVSGTTSIGPFQFVVMVTATSVLLANP